MSRLRPELIDRALKFAHRMQDVAEAVAGSRKKASNRIVEQMSGCGTSVAANLFEADEAMSRRDFTKCIGICVKELNECRFWLRFVSEREWLTPRRLDGLMSEADELRRVLGSMLARIRKADAPNKEGPRSRTLGERSA